ncbi:MAG: peptidoglycan-binding domain-containing protein [Nannocystaceae bacterium]
MSGESSEPGLLGRLGKGLFGGARVDAEPTPCGGTVTVTAGGTSWIEIELVDEDGRPVAAQRYRVDFDDGPPQRGRVGRDGLVRVEGLAAGECTVCFPDLDLSAWELGGQAPTDSEHEPRRAAERHEVTRAECMASIAAQHGFHWRAVWGHPGNKGLRRDRSSPFVLAPNDVVQVPERRPGQHRVPTDQRHTFVRKALPAMLRLRLRSKGRPLINTPYTLECAGRILRGRTDLEGKVEIPVPPDVPAGLLRVGEGDAQRVYRLMPRALDPVSGLRGMQSRLANLGYHHGAVHGDLDDSTQGALRRFQADHGLEVSGEANLATTNAVSTAYCGTAVNR